MSNFVPVSPVVGSRRWRLGCSTAPSLSILRPAAPAGTGRSTGSSGSRCREPPSLHGAPSAEGGSANSARPNSLAAKSCARDIRATRGRAEAAARPAGAALAQQHIAGGLANHRFVQTMDAKVVPTKTLSPGAAWRRAAFERLEAARPRRKTRAQATRLEVERASAYYALNEAAIPDGLGADPTAAAARAPKTKGPGARRGKSAITPEAAAETNLAAAFR